MYGRLCPSTTQNRSSMYHHHDTWEIKNGAPVTQNSGGQNVKKWGCVQTQMSTLLCVLCRPDKSTFAVSLQRTFKQPGTNEISSITVPCDYEGRGCGDPSINI